MNEQTQKLLAALLIAPDLVQSFRKDPIATLSKVANSDAAAPLRAVMKSAVANLTPLRDSQPLSSAFYLSSVVVPERSTGTRRTTSAAGELPVVGIVSLGVIMASVTVLGTVCAVAIAREDK